MRKLFLITCLGLFVGSLNAQITNNDDRQLAIDQIIELVSENLESENLDFTTFLEDLNYFFQHPLNLNRATREDLERLLILDDFQIQALLEHKMRTGRILSLYELQGIDGWDLNLIASIVPFIKVTDDGARPRLTWRSISQEGKHEAFARFQSIVEEQEGYSPIDDSTLAASPNRRYLGSPLKVLTRYRFRYLNNISIGITAEKDAGEQFMAGANPRGFDFHSGHVYFGNYGKLKHAIIGDYQAQFGQGLNYWTGLAFGKSANIAGIKRTAREIAPYTSADENNFMRGAAATLQFGKLEVTGFVSSKMVDANITVYDSLAGNDDGLVSEFSSFQLSGFHRTPGELEDKDAVRETNAGGHVRYSQDRFQLGVTGAYTRYSGDISGSSLLYRQFEPFSQSFFVGGFDYQFLIRNIIGFGEVSSRSDGGNAMLNGAIISLDPKLDVSVFQRSYSSSYSNPRSNAVGESSRNTNESGIYMGVSSKFTNQWTFNGYMDLFKFDWLRFRTDAPSNGKEYFAQLEFKPRRTFSAYARYRFEDKYENVSGTDQATTPIDVLHRQWFRLNWQYTLNKTLSLRNRLEMVSVTMPNGENERGYLMYQDVVYKPKWPAKYQFKLRYAMFDTKSYNSRIYAYEHDVLYSFSVPAYYFRGSRFYLIAAYDFARWGDITARFSQTYFSNQKENGSALNTIEGSTRTEVKVQVRVKF
jgi:hypothetical protein